MARSLADISAEATAAHNPANGLPPHAAGAHSGRQAEAHGNGNGYGKVWAIEHVAPGAETSGSGAAGGAAAGGAGGMKQVVVRLPPRTAMRRAEPAVQHASTGLSDKLATAAPAPIIPLGQHTAPPDYEPLANGLPDVTATLLASIPAVSAASPALPGSYPAHLPPANDDGPPPIPPRPYPPAGAYPPAPVVHSESVNIVRAAPPSTEPGPATGGKLEVAPSLGGDADVESPGSAIDNEASTPAGPAPAIRSPATPSSPTTIADAAPPDPPQPAALPAAPASPAPPHPTIPAIAITSDTPPDTPSSSYSYRIPSHPALHPHHRLSIPSIPAANRSEKTTRRPHHAPRPLWVSDAELAGEKCGLLRRLGVGTGAGIGGLGQGRREGAVDATSQIRGETSAINGPVSSAQSSNKTASSASQRLAPVLGPSSSIKASTTASTTSASSASARLAPPPSPTTHIQVSLPVSPAPPSHSPFADRVAAYVHDFYASLDVKSARPGPGQWTVLAAYLAIRREPGPVAIRDIKRTGSIPQSALSDYTYPRATPMGTSIRILSLATGVKCLGGIVPDRADVLVDMHAEILARRELELLLAEEIWELRQAEGVWRSDHLLDLGWEWQLPKKTKGSAPGSQRGSPGTIGGGGARRVVPGAAGYKSAPTLTSSTKKPKLRPTSGRFRVRSDTEIWLYTSHAPCGTASNAAHLARMDREDEMLRECLQALGVEVNDDQVVTDPATASGSDWQTWTAAGKSSAGRSIATLSGELANGYATPSNRPHPLPAPPTNGAIASQSALPHSSPTAPTSNPLSSTSTFRSDRLAEQPQLDKKPSRPDARATTAYSCSDKLSRYQVLGYQGGRLSRALEPVRLAGAIIGEEFDEMGMRKLMGGGEGYSRTQDGVAEVKSGRSDPHGLAWLRGIPRDFDVLHSSVEYRYGRGSALRDAPSDSTAIPADKVAALPPEILGLPFAVLRDHIIPRAPISPFSVASSWHAGAYIEVITPTGRDARVPKVKKVEESEGGYTAASRTRISRQCMWDTWDQLCIASERGPSKRQDEKGSAGWRAASAWMEEVGPFKGWHENINRRGLHGRPAPTSDAEDSEEEETFIDVGDLDDDVDSLDDDSEDLDDDVGVLDNMCHE